MKALTPAEATVLPSIAVEIRYVEQGDPVFPPGPQFVFQTTLSYPNREKRVLRETSAAAPDQAAGNRLYHAQCVAARVAAHVLRELLGPQSFVELPPGCPGPSSEKKRKPRKGA